MDKAYLATIVFFLAVGGGDIYFMFFSDKELNDPTYGLLVFSLIVSIGCILWSLKEMNKKEQDEE